MFVLRSIGYGNCYHFRLKNVVFVWSVHQPKKFHHVADVLQRFGGGLKQVVINYLMTTSSGNVRDKL